MNLVLFERGELDRPLAPADPRHAHVARVLKRGVGGSFDCGLIDGAIGRATITRAGASGLHLSFAWEREPPPLDPISVLIGLPRPQTARKILRELTALGASRLAFFPAAKSEPSYASSSLWSCGEVRRLLLEGAQQAFCTRLPEVARPDSLADALEGLPPTGSRLALDVYEGTAPLSELSLAQPVAVAIGPERGWQPDERNLLRANGFKLVHLGSRILRTETACVAAATLIKARLGRL